MELILISNTKLKIMLDEGDMKKYKISDETNYAEPETRKAIRNILDKAREQVGFNTEGAEIFVQLYTSRKGGCELFVTKSKLNESASDNCIKLKKSAADDLSIEKRQKKKDTCNKSRECEETLNLIPQIKEKYYGQLSAGSGEIAFSFPSMNILFKVCKILQDLKLTYPSNAYSDESGICYLLMRNTGISSYSCLDKLTVLLEYGNKENPEHMLTYISEYGKIICKDNAIEILSQF